MSRGNYQYVQTHTYAYVYSRHDRIFIAIIIRRIKIGMYARLAECPNRYESHF